MKKLVKMIAACGLAGAVSVSACMVGFAEEAAAENDRVQELESENAQLEERLTQLESENAALQEQIEALLNPETEAETEPSTEIVGTQYTDASIVKPVQEALNAAGFDCGTPDGQAGSKTEAAIRAFELEKGINVNGVITDELLEALGIADQIAEQAAQAAKMSEYSTEYSYTQIARDPSSFEGVKMSFKGKVLQDQDVGQGIRVMRLAADSSYDNVILVTYESDIIPVKILEDDIVTIYGECLGEQTYTTVMGAAVTIPWIQAEIIDMSDVAM